MIDRSKLCSVQIAMTKNTNLSLRLNFEMEEAPCENPIHASAQTRTARSSEISRALYGTGITGLSFFFSFFY